MRKSWQIPRVNRSPADQASAFPVVMNNEIPPLFSVSEKKNLGGSKFSACLKVETGTSKVALSQSQTVTADAGETAVKIAKESFSRWINKEIDPAIKNMPPTCEISATLGQL